MQILLKNGFILTENGLSKSDILVENEKIKDIGNISLENFNGLIYDYSNKFIIPGGIDVHTHFNIDVGVNSVDDFYSGGLAAIYGGTTTIVDHPGFGPNKCPLDFQIKNYTEFAKICPVDYSFHGVLQHVPNDIEEQMLNLKNKGITSFKLYMTYTYLMNDYEILKIFEIAKKLNIIICVHAENHGMIEFLKEKYKKQGLTSPIYHSKSRPDYSESEAVYRLLTLAKINSFEKLYFVHISCKKSLDILKNFKDNGINFFVETCPQYLILTQDYYLKNNGENYILSPPLRNKEDNIAIQNYINLGYIDVVATDHCTFSLKDKALGKENFLICPNGIPGVQERVPIMFSEFLKGNISAKSFLNTCSLNPAKIFGLYPQKGTIEIGSDADIVVLSLENFKFTSPISKANYSVFENYNSLVKVHSTFIRGNLILENGNLKNKTFKGIFLKRK